jgi:hypothetical protein
MKIGFDGATTLVVGKDNVKLSAERLQKWSKM